MPYNALQVLPGCFPLLILSRRQENMPYNAIQGLPGCFLLLILSRRAGEYALGGPPEGPVLPSEFHDRELPSNTIIIPRVSCGYPNPNKLICKQPSPCGRDCRHHLTAGTAGITLRPGLPASPCGRDCRLLLTAGTAAYTLRPGLPASPCGRDCRHLTAGRILRQGCPGAGLLHPMARLRGGGRYS